MFDFDDQLAASCKAIDIPCDPIRQVIAGLESHDAETWAHSRRVAWFGRGLARALGIHGLDYARFSLAVLLHDVGKLEIPRQTLKRSGRLSPAEWEIVREHPTASRRILSDLGMPWPVLDAVAAHHERLDELGYPRGLGIGQIPLEARIIAVADAFDAMTTHRPYRLTRDAASALLELRAQAGYRFDPHIVEVFTFWQSWSEPARPVRSRAWESRRKSISPVNHPDATKSGTNPE